MLDGAKAGMKAVMDIFVGNEPIHYQEFLVPLDKCGVIPKI